MAKAWSKNSKFGTKEFLEEVAQLAQAVREEIAQASELGEFDRSDKARRARITRAQDDFEFFCRTYFPHHARGNPSRFHAFLFERLPELVEAPEGQREIIAAPRGNAKSTYATQLFPLWCVITRRKRYPIILSDAIEVASMMLEGIKAELETNPRLAFDFPEACGAGPVWQVGVIVTRNGAKLQAGGAQKRIRGARHGSNRPDLIILDDIENDENVRSPEQRDKREAWLDKAVEPLGPPDGSMDMIYVGTVLHLDAVLSRKMKNPMWRATKFQAVMAWPDRMDLWEQWEEALRNDGREAADTFWRENRAEMERGAEVLWPEVQPFKRLMEIRVRIGLSAFNSEYQNSPIAEDATFSKVVFWVERAPRLVYFGALDPSLGKNNRSRDPSAILVGGFDREQARLDVIEASIRRRVPSIIISDVIALQRRYQCVMWFVEAVQFQEFLRTELIKAAIQQGVPLPAKAVSPTTDKALRIESLQPILMDGRIRLHASQTTLLEQLTGFPQADHDDGPDCLEMLWTGAVSFAPLGEFQAAGDRNLITGNGFDPGGGFGMGGFDGGRMDWSGYHD
ncbi:phage terminase large subunit [Telmatospirillum sp. J64-1]|uniref:phage terminase large subunit n=1 Tax=Telmatospirillum sp. J64-1 TaxID=2502183 RepID=UPI00115F35A6|nr:phage terminase large subunit [Telmatospirillum sp. J64-1]